MVAALAADGHPVVITGGPDEVLLAEAVATAYAVPSVVLFGPSSPARWGPVTNGPHTALWAGRTGDPHAAVVDPGLCEITVADVVTAARARLEGHTSR